MSGTFDCFTFREQKWVSISKEKVYKHWKEHPVFLKRTIRKLRTLNVGDLVSYMSNNKNEIGLIQGFLVDDDEGIYRDFCCSVYTTKNTSKNVRILSLEKIK